jgi:hypothetical protein
MFKFLRIKFVRSQNRVKAFKLGPIQQINLQNSFEVKKSFFCGTQRS